jgi:hypothetical protein
LDHACTGAVRRGTNLDKFKEVRVWRLAKGRIIAALQIKAGDNHPLALHEPGQNVDSGVLVTVTDVAPAETDAIRALQPAASFNPFWHMPPG